jgi:hypothetical protein
MIKSRKMRWAGHVARKEKDKYMQDICGKARRKQTTFKTKNSLTKLFNGLRKGAS